MSDYDQELEAAARDPRIPVLYADESRQVNLHRAQAILSARLAALEKENERLRDELEQRSALAALSGDKIEKIAAQLWEIDRQTATTLSFLGLALKSPPIPRGVRERMERDRLAALSGTEDPGA